MIKFYLESVYNKQPKQKEWLDLVGNDTIIQYNCFLQYVQLLYTVCAIKDKSSFNPYFMKYTTWGAFPIKNSVIMTEKENEQLLEDNAHKYKLDKIQCQLCKGFGHPTEFCLKRIPKSHRLGLAHHVEKLLYVFLT